jgi:transposase
MASLAAAQLGLVELDALHDDLHQEHGPQGGIRRARPRPQTRPVRVVDPRRPHREAGGQAGLAWVAKVNHRLIRAYLLKEQLRQVFALKGEDGKRLLDHWLAWARRCRIPAFVHLAQRIAKHRISINASLSTGCLTG